MEKLISIIIPTYNMEAYIGKCLDSLLIGDINLVEILVINDGSKDRSSEIAHSYAERYPGSIRVIDKPNGNYGSCINTALPLSTGRYVKILDADDTFDTEAFAQFVKLLAEVDDDVVISSFITVDPSGKVIKVGNISNYGVSENRTYRNDQIFYGALKKYTAMHRIAYNRRVFDRFSYHQTEGISYTDIEWATVPMAHCETIRFTDLPVYRYLDGREGQTVGRSQIMKSLNHLFTVAEYLLHESSSADSAVVRDYIFSHAVDYHSSFYNLILRNKSEESMGLLRKYEQKLRDSFPDAYDAIAEIRYSEHTSFCIFKDLRKKGYPVDYEVPLIEKLKISFKIRMKGLFSR